MDAVEMVELATVVARHGSLVIHGPGPLSTEGLRRYWAASKCRLDRWGLALRRYERETARSGSRCRMLWPRTRAVAVEALGSEVLTRVWSAVVATHDRNRGLAESEPIVESVLRGHLEARRRILALMADAPSIPAADVALLNLLRRRCERWTDLFIGHLMDAFDVGRFAFKADRARDLAVSVSRQHRAGADQVAWSLTLGSIRTAFQLTRVSANPNRDLNSQIAASVLSCFPADLLDCTTALRSIWILRMQNIQTDAETLVDELLELEGLTSQPR